MEKYIWTTMIYYELLWISLPTPMTARVYINLPEGTIYIYL